MIRRDRWLVVAAAALLGCAACGGEVMLEEGDEGALDMEGDAAPGGHDMASSEQDQRSADLSTHDMPQDLTLARDADRDPVEMDAVDMSSPPVDMATPVEDMGVDMPPPVEEPWPMHSGTPCDVDGTPGVCLPTSRCGGNSVSGRCPGPATMQCCIESCDRVQGEAGQCSTELACGPSWDASATCSGPAGQVGCCEASAQQGIPLGTLWNTYYYLANENDYTGAANTALNDSNCQPIVQVSAAFSDSVCIEGSGKLSDGRVINYARTCQCGRPCPTGGIICYSVVDPLLFPWGKGARNNPLEPLRSLAVDRNTIPLGSTIYLLEWDGYQVPMVDGIGGFVHDGCFRADDVGGAIRGLQVDLFSGTKPMWRRLEQDFPTRSNYTASRDAGKCAYLK